MNRAQNLDYRANNFLRMQLMETLTSIINSFPGIAQGRFLGSSHEIMHHTAAPEARVAIGNYSANDLNDNPTERLDVDGTARLHPVRS